MPSTYSLVRERQEEAALEFGAMLRRWRVINGWTQYTAKRWADEAGHASGSHSGLSELERGLTRHPRSAVFLSLAEMNQRIAEADFAGVRTRELLDQLKGSKAILIRQQPPQSSGRPLEWYKNTSNGHVRQPHPVSARDVPSPVHGALRHRREVRGRP